MADLLPSTFTAHGRLRGTGTSASGSTENPSNPLAASSGSPQALPPISTGATPWPTVQGAGIPFQSRCVDTATTGVTTTPVEPWAARTFEFTGSYGQSRALCVCLACSLFADYAAAAQEPAMWSGPLRHRSCGRPSCKASG